MLLLELQRLFSYLSNWLLERRKLFFNAFKEQKYGYYFYFCCTKGQECHDDKLHVGQKHLHYTQS